MFKSKDDKTWSSVSNSSLSKTFALCQFRKLKVQKLCFLPPNVILGLKKWVQKSFWVRKNFDPQKIKGSNKIWVWKNFGWKKFWVWKKFLSEKNLGPAKKIWVWKKFRAWKSFGSKKSCVKKKCWIQKILGPKKI